VPCVATSLSGRAGLTANLTDARALGALLDRVNPTVVIHCAAMVPRAGAGYGDDAAAAASVAMLRGLIEHGCPRIVFASSMTVYGVPGEAPVREEDAGPPFSAYARGKWQAEQLLLERGVAGDVALRLPGLFGPTRRAGLLYNAARAFLTRRDFKVDPAAGGWAAMAVDDAGEYLLRAVTRPAALAAEAVNVGYAGAFSVGSAVAAIAALCQVKWQPPRGPVHSFAMNLERLAARYGLLDIGFAERLRQLVDAVRLEVRGKTDGNRNAV